MIVLETVVEYENRSEDLMFIAMKPCAVGSRKYSFK
jgi:hypothetical protein